MTRVKKSYKHILSIFFTRTKFRWFIAPYFIYFQCFCSVYKRYDNVFTMVFQAHTSSLFYEHFITALSVKIPTKTPPPLKDHKFRNLLGKPCHLLHTVHGEYNEPRPSNSDRSYMQYSSKSIHVPYPQSSKQKTAYGTQHSTVIIIEMWRYKQVYYFLWFTSSVLESSCDSTLKYTWEQVRGFTTGISTPPHSLKGNRERDEFTCTANTVLIMYTYWSIHLGCYCLLVTQQLSYTL